MDPLHVPVDEFLRLGQRSLRLAAEYLEQLDARASLPKESGEQIDALFDEPLPEAGLGAAALDRLEEVLRLTRAHHARFAGYVLGVGDPVAALGDLVASVSNQTVTAWRSAPGPVTVERRVVSWLAEAIGCTGFAGSLAGGGSMANLMGLAMAREARQPANESGARPACVYASDEVHMSVSRAIALLGLGRANLRLLPSDQDFRLQPETLEAAIAEDLRAGRSPMAVVASAGTTNTGAVDPLEALGSVARRHRLWFHVDGAYGALAAIARPEQFRGLALADSLSLDPHKWLHQPVDCGCILYRDREAARRAFSYSGAYAKTSGQDPLESFAFFDESIELSRRFRALKLWLSLRYHGLGAFRAAIERDLGNARRLADAVAVDRRLELLAPGELSAVCFRYVGAGGLPEPELDRLNAALLSRVLARGRVYLSSTVLRGRFALRPCFVNHRTEAGDVDAFLEEILAAGEALEG